MARELDAILDHGEASRAASCIGKNASVSFLDQIISPIYNTLAAVSSCQRLRVFLAYYKSICSRAHILDGLLCFDLDLIEAVS